jgi:hypothetical protein
LRIIHPSLPAWPIDLAPGEHFAHAAPITLGHVLSGLHRALHTRISQRDYEVLSAAEQNAVNHAFRRRCRAEAVRSGVPADQLTERAATQRSDGVKRVDFLLGKTVFRGLVKVAGDPDGCVRVVTEDSPRQPDPPSPVLSAFSLLPYHAGGSASVQETAAMVERPNESDGEKHSELPMALPEPTETPTSSQEPTNASEHTRMVSQYSTSISTVDPELSPDCFQQGLLYAHVEREQLVP